MTRGKLAVVAAGGAAGIVGLRLGLMYGFTKIVAVVAAMQAAAESSPSGRGELEVVISLEDAEVALPA